MRKIQLNEKSLIKILKKIINEQFDENKRYETGTFTWAANELVLYSENTEPIYRFAKTNRNIVDVFNLALKSYAKDFGNPLEYDDKETLFYDFAAHYSFPEEN